MNDFGEDSDIGDSGTEKSEDVDIESGIAMKSPEERKQGLEERRLRLEEEKEKRRQQQEAARNA